MRLSTMFGLCLGFALMTAGCDPVAENRLYREGIGTDLNREQLAEATRLQDEYIKHICHQAGLAPNGDRFRCDAPSGSDWQIIVQAGMNDIDQRCDAYLAWLDDRKRSKAPILSQLNIMQTATGSIMRLAGAGADPIAIVGVAFGLASDTFTNINSRLLMEVNHSTVQAVVLSRRSDFRLNIVDVRIDNRPTAIHALRTYLNICMPFTIEMTINTTVTAFELGGATALNRMPVNTPATVDASSAATPPRRGDRPIEVTPAPKKQVLNPAPGVESKVLGFDRAAAMQRALCLPATGDFGGEVTRRGFADFKAAFKGVPGFEIKAPGVIENDAQLRKFQDALALGSCDQSRLKTPFEAGVFTRFGAASVRGRIQRAMETINRRLPDGQKLTIPAELKTPGTASLGASIRPAVIALRAHYAKTISTIAATEDTINEVLWQQITKDGLLTPP
jgi:hypothetical protein